MKIMRSWMTLALGAALASPALAETVMFNMNITPNGGAPDANNHSTLTITDGTSGTVHVTLSLDSSIYGSDVKVGSLGLNLVSTYDGALSPYSSGLTVTNNDFVAGTYATLPSTKADGDGWYNIIVNAGDAFGLGTQTGTTFNFDIIGSGDFAGLKAADFLDKSVNNKGELYASSYFAGVHVSNTINNTGSQWLFAGETPQGGGTPSTPLPTAAFAGTGLLGGLGLVRRRRTR